MMKQPTLKGMRKKEWLDLLEKTEKLLQKIFESSDNIDNLLEQSKADKGEIENNADEVSELLIKTKEHDAEVKERVTEIRELYGELLEDELGEDNEVVTLSKKNEIKELVAEMEDKYNEFSQKVSDIENSLEKYNGEITKLQDLYTKQEQKYDKYYKKINKELSAGTTSVALASTFANKVKEYKKRSNMWSLAFVFILVAFVVWGLFFSGGSRGVIEEVLLHWLYYLPVVSGVVWLAVFTSNRRAELKKLEESYRHKEVMARSYIGYKESIEELQKEMGTEDYALLEKHMNNLLDTISEDSSKFMIEKGENHPFIDLVKSRISKGGKMPKSFSDIAGDYTFKASLEKE